MKLFDYPQYGTIYKIKLTILTYMDGNLAIKMDVKTEEGWEPWGYLTVNLGLPMTENHAYIDTNGNGNDILAWIIRNGLAVPTGTVTRSGYCQYPEYRFRPEKLQEIDPDGYEKYLRIQKQKKSA